MSSRTAICSNNFSSKLFEYFAFAVNLLLFRVEVCIDAIKNVIGGTVRFLAVALSANNSDFDSVNF